MQWFRGETSIKWDIFECFEILFPVGKVMYCTYSLLKIFVWVASTTGGIALTHIRLFYFNIYIRKTRLEEFKRKLEYALFLKNLA